MSEEWQYQEPEFSTHYPNYRVPGSSGKKKKSRTGLLAIMIILVLVTGAVTVAINFWDLHMEVADNKVSLVMGEESAPDANGWRQVSEQAYVDPTERDRTPPRYDGGVEIQDTPRSVENKPFTADGALSLQQIYEKVAPSVASISCVHVDGGSNGTGIVMSSDGYVITNYHVIEDATRIYVLLGEQLQYEAVLIGGDETTDLAVLKIDAKDLRAAEFGDSDVLRVGDTVVAIGDPLGTQLRGTMTDGIISAINRDLNLAGRQMTLLQTNAALNSGNSGGPLINCYGQVIGINTMKMSSYSYGGTTVEGLGFAIPIAHAKPIVDELISRGYVSGRPAIGIMGENVDLRGQLFYHLPAGVSITAILDNSDALVKGLERDDVIVSLDDMPIRSLDDLVAAKEGMTAGEEVCLTVFRGGRYYYVNVQLMEQTTPDIY